MPVTVTNNACSKLVGAIDDAVTQLTVGPEGVFFPQLEAGDWFWATISDDPVNTSQLPEIVKVTAVAYNSPNFNFTIERGQALDGGLPKAWSDQANIQLLVTAELLTDLVTGGIAISGATSFILSSVVSVLDYTTAEEDNGRFIHMSPGVDDLTLSLHEIPSTADEDFRIVVNKRSNTEDGKVLIEAFPGQTINGLNSIELGQQYSAVILTYRAGEINWDAISVPNYAAVPDDDKVYGIIYGPEFVVVVEEAPNDGNYYVRQNESWQLGVPEAPQDGTGYVRKDGSWSPEETGSGDTTSSVPTGSVLPFAGSEPPNGYLLCDGSPYGTADFPALFAVIGTTYGAPSATEFNVPDLRGRNVRGVDNMGGTEAGIYPGRNTLGSKSGAYQHTLSISNMPAHNHGGTSAAGSHSHTLSINSGGSHTHQVGSMSKVGDFNGDPGSTHWSNRAATKTTTSAGSHGHSGSIGSTGNHSHTIPSQGSGAAKSYASPFMDMNYIIRV